MAPTVHKPVHLKTKQQNVAKLHQLFLQQMFECCWCESFLESNSPDILALCETNLDNSIDFALANSSVRGYLPLRCWG